MLQLKQFSSRNQGSSLTFHEFEVLEEVAMTGFPTIVPNACQRRRYGNLPLE